MSKIYKATLTVILVLSINLSFGQSSVLRPQIAEIAKSAKGIVGVSVLGLEDRDTVNYNGNARLVMESLIKQSTLKRRICLKHIARYVINIRRAMLMCR